MHENDGAKSQNRVQADDPNLTTKSYTAANKAAWQASVSAHSAEFEALKKAASKGTLNTFDATMTALLSSLDLKGKRAAQVGCNNARELLSLASFGAIPTLGIDQASTFLAQGEELAKALWDGSGQSSQNPQSLILLDADIYELPASLGDYDIVLITIGVLNWMPDLSRFFEIVAGLLVPNGQLIIYETHPFLEVFDPSSERPFEPAYDYFATEPDASDEIIAYDGVGHGTAATSYWFSHCFSDIVMSILGAGLVLEHLQEYAHSNREVDYDIYANGKLPLCFSLIASKPERH